MRRMLLVCACLASLAGGYRLLAQDDVSYADAPDLRVADNSPIYENGSASESGPVADSGSSEMVYDGASGDTANCDGGTCDNGTCNGSQCNGSQCNSTQCGPAGPCPPYGPAQQPCGAGMGYYAKRAAQKTDCAVYGALSGATHPCKTLHGLIEKDLAWKMAHCKCLGHCYGNQIAANRAANTPWHGDYYYPTWGAPVALVVPPTCEYQTNYSWGVPSHRIEPIDHQFGRTAAGAGYSSFGSVGFKPPPYYPNDTNQFGVYYVRGPW